MPDQIPESVKAVRSLELIELSKKHQKQYEQWYLGKNVEVLVEERMEQLGEDVWTGHTREYMKVVLKNEKNLKNSIIKMEIESTSQIID